MADDPFESFIPNTALVQFALSVLPVSVRGQLFGNVAIKLFRRFGQSESMEDLDRAIMYNKHTMSISVAVIALY
jgi:hypothetical protein